VGKEPRFGAEEPANPPKTARLGERRSPPVISLATKYWLWSRNYNANFAANLGWGKPLR